MFRSVPYLVSLFLAFLIVPQLSQGENYSSWSGSQLLLLNTTSKGATVLNDVHNFPVLVRLNHGTFDYFSQTQPGGADIRFAKTDGTHLSYEIERWVDNPNNVDTAEIWVKLDTVFGNNATQSFVMYWGKANAVDSSKSGLVFGTSNSYSSVLHLDEDGNVAAYDATYAKNDAVLASGFNSFMDVSGAIGIAREFDGIDDYLQINKSLIKNALSTGNKKTTLSYWVKADAVLSTKVILFEGEGGSTSWGAQQQLHFGFGNDAAGTSMDKSLTLYLGDGENNSSSGNPIRPTVPYTDVTNWHYAAVTIDNSIDSTQTAILYLDGIPVDTSTIPGAIAMGHWGSNTRIGRQGEDGGYFDGILDEIRISDTTRSADWLKLCFENQKSNQTLVTYGGVPPDAATISTCIFDSETAMFRVGWNIDTAKYHGQIDIGIAGSLKEYPENMNNGTIITTPSLHGEMLLRLNPLLPDTLYYVSLFVRKPAGEWIGGTNLMRDSLRTKKTIIAEASRITTLLFDSVTTSIRVGWFIDTTKYNGQFNVGFAYGLDTFPASMNNGMHIVAPVVNGNTLLHPKPLLPDTTYYVSMFVQKPEGVWIGATDSLRGIVRTGALILTDAAKMSHLTFDPIAVAITVGWDIDTSKYGSQFDVGVAYSLDTFPGDMSNGAIIEKPQVHGETLLRLTQPQSDTIYYVSLFVRKSGGVWTGATLSMRDTVRVGVSLSTTVAAITSLSFDSLTPAIVVGWKIDTTKYNGKLDIGIVHSVVEYPIAITSGTIIPTPPVNGSMVLQPQPLHRDTLYYLSLFVRKPGGEWVRMVNSVQSTIYCGKIRSSEIADFVSTSVGDTIQLFNKQVLLWEDSISSKSVDTLELYPFDVPQGFTVVGTSFKFTDHYPTTPVSIGIRIGALPENVSISDVRIYNDSDGVIKVNYLSQVDSVKGIVYGTITNRQLPFIAMIDQVKPVVLAVNSDNSPVYPNVDIVNAVSITDNSANVKWQYLYNRADSVLIVQKSGILSGIQNELQLTIPGESGVVSSESGVRSLLIVSDGVHSDTIHLSRSVYRAASDMFTTEQDVWKPVYATAVLNRNSPDSLIIARTSNENALYDQRYRRLFRWVQTDNNSNNIIKWVEYDPVNVTTIPYFSMVPGRVFWFKTKEKNTINLGQGYTVSLRVPFSFTLPPKQYTDLGTPFRFGVQIGDILSASGSSDEDIHVYEWKYNALTKRYTCEPLYFKNMVGKQDKSKLITFKNSGAYCFYNPSDQPIELKIPSVPSTENVSKGLTKIMNTPCWGANLITTTTKGQALPVLYCGYAPGLEISNYPVAPSFEEIKIFIHDSTLGAHQGHYIAQDASGGLVKKIHIANSSDSTLVITYRFEVAGAFPESFSAYLFDNVTEQFMASGMISVAPHSTVSRWFIIGDSQWRDSFAKAAHTFNFKMQPIYPNPALSSVTIGYSLGMQQQKQVHITVFDLQGRKVWEKRIVSQSELTPGNYMITWDGTNVSHIHVGAGMYLVRMSVINASGTTIQQLNQRFSFIP